MRMGGRSRGSFICSRSIRRREWMCRRSGCCSRSGLCLRPRLDSSRRWRYFRTKFFLVSERTKLIAIEWYRSGLEGGVDELLGFGLDLFEVVFAFEGFAVDLVDVFGAGGAGGEPAILGGDFEAAYGCVVAGGFGEDGRDGFAG